MSMRRGVGTGDLFGGIAALVLLGSCVVALVLSAPLQRPISEPILALTKTARVIAERKDYTVRAAAQGRGEVGVLTDAFNQMLAGIAEREQALSATNEALREEIVERNLAEQRVVTLPPSLSTMSLTALMPCAIWLYSWSENFQ